jgi:site-specific recombinase XerC
MFYRAPMSALPRLSNRDVLAQAVAMTSETKPGVEAAEAEPLTTAAAVALVASHLQHLVETGGYSGLTVTKMLAQMASLSMFMTDGLHRPLVSHIDPGAVQQWIGCSLGGRRRRGGTPSASTQRNRRTAARLFFRVLRQLGLNTADPTLDIRAPRGGRRTTRPLTDTEMVLVRYSCADLEGNFLLGAAMALAEATATTSELAEVLVRHIDLTAGTVRLVGIGRRLARTGYLSNWGIEQLRKRVAWLTSNATPGTDIGSLSLTYAGTVGGASAGAASAQLMQRVLEAAGLQGEPNVRPGSIPAALGRRVWHRTGDLRLVAHALGCRTTDAAARQIDIDTRQLPKDAAEQIRGAVLDADPTTPVHALRGGARPTRRQPAEHPVTPRIAASKARPVRVRATRLEGWLR